MIDKDQLVLKVLLMGMNQAEKILMKGYLKNRLLKQSLSIVYKSLRVN